MLVEVLKSLKMGGALNYISGREDTYSSLPILGLLKAELEHRESSRVKRRLTIANFPVDKEWHELDTNFNQNIDFAAIEKLLKGDFVRKKENICFVGTQGTGKTHSLISVGRSLCRLGFTVKFQKACKLVTDLEEAKAQNQLSKLFESLKKPDVLLIDELGFVPFSENGSRLLFEVFASRYEVGPIAVTTNLSFEKWVQVFGSVEMTAALLDRFTHRAHIFTFNGASYRLEQQKGRKKL